MVSGVKHVILILSGKGGVGKSTVSVKLALGFKEKGFKVGLLDLDLCGPSIPFMLGLENSPVHQGQNGWVPVYSDQEQKLAVMSIGFLLNNRNDSVIWRGPKKTSMIKQFLNDVYWQDIDFLIVDTPPGTSDEHITVVEVVKEICDGAILITTPQNVSLDDVMREVTFCQKTKIPVIGIVENMSGFVCPDCKECTNIFSSGGGKSLAEKKNLRFLGCLPIDPALSSFKGDVNMSESANSSVSTIINNVITAVTNQ